jgi:hypothetical protein
MTKEQIIRELKRNLSKGFRYAWVAKDRHKLTTALTFKQVTTCLEAAELSAKKVFIADKQIKIWELEKELVRLEK